MQVTSFLRTSLKNVFTSGGTVFTYKIFELLYTCSFHFKVNNLIFVSLLLQVSKQVFILTFFSTGRIKCQRFMKSIYENSLFIK